MDTSLIVDIAQFIGALAALIIIHELGHFTVARLLNVEVEEFGLGFPPRAATLFQAGGTRYSLNWLPLGGFVRLKGENDPDVPGGFASANPWTRLAILAAGPFANLLVGVLLYAVIFTQIGRPITNQVQVIEVAQNSPADQAGMLQGDLFLQINETEIDSTTALQEAIFASLEQPTTVTIERQGETLQFTLVPRENPPPGEGAIGIVMGNPTTPINLFAALPMGGVAVYEHIGQLLLFPIRIIQGQISPEQGRLAGYKGMFDIYQQVQRRETLPGVPGSVNVLGFFATITISFAVLNLLPIPALDGGRITFLIPEIVLRKRIPPQYENVINLVSFGLLLMILLYINIQDFVNPIQLPK